jgi:SAM-dependent methyltransferase
MSDKPHHPDFWNVRYETGKTGWDLGRTPSRLERYLAAHPAGGRVFIPGCGSGWELEAFARAGYDALALDFAPAAVARAQARVGPALAGRIVLGDFFHHDLGAPFDLVYERTFFCALPPERRPDYIRRVRELLKPGGLLLGFFYLGTERGGPPYALFPEDETGLFGPAFAVQVDEPSPDGLPMFEGGERWRELAPL